MKDNYEYFYSLDFSKLTDYKEIHPIIQKSLDFPDYYGCNWSAFWDCLTDMYGDPIHIEIIGLDVIRRKFDDSADKILEILKRFKHFNNDLFCKDITIEVITDTGREFIE